MKRKLAAIAKQLSEDDIQELMRLKKMGDKRVVALQKKRDRLAASLESVDSELADLLGSETAAPKRGRRGRKPAAAKSPAVKKVAGRRRGKPARNNNLSAAVREVFGRAGAPLKAREVVEALPSVGMKVKNEADMRKRISVVLASQKNHFEQVSRGVYQLRD